jgi:hypothetical protein
MLNFTVVHIVQLNVKLYYISLCFHSDLYGAVSHPLKIARTVITGQSVSVVCRLLYLLTYFIRCSEIQPGFIQVSHRVHYQGLFQDFVQEGANT